MQKIYICLFAILYLAVALVSGIHAVQFFGLANNSWMAVILAISFELGQAAVLFSLLTSKNERGKIMPWVLMGIFTLVQVLGNVYSSYKHIILESPDNLRYFKEPIFIWTQLPDDQATVIVTYIVGAILPICALLLTSMVTNHLQTDEVEDKGYEIEQNINNENLIKNVDEIQNEDIEIINNETLTQDTEDIANDENINLENPIDFENNRQSKFINLK